MTMAQFSSVNLFMARNTNCFSIGNGKNKLRFLNKLEKSDGCWIWKGSKDKRGYGVISINSKTVKVPRLSWSIYNGKIPTGKIICHKCDNPPCVNPEHLFLGTWSDNMQDMKKKKRNLAGEKHKMAKLTAKQVYRIKDDCESTTNNLAKKYGVHPSTIQRILNGKRWSCLKPEAKKEKCPVCRGKGKWFEEQALTKIKMKCFCEACQGTGEAKPCPRCDGTGEAYTPGHGDGTDGHDFYQCPRCGGSGERKE